MSDKYGRAAVDAVKIMHINANINPVSAWETALGKYYKVGSSGLKKGCPRETFLGLCEEGLIKSIPAGNYTKSVMNKSYGLIALNLIKNNISFTNNKITLWEQVLGEKHIAHNSQMDVVIALWKEDLFI